MKSKIRLMAILLIVTAFAFFFTTCVDQTVRAIGTEANLLSFKIVSGNVPDTATKVALPIPASTMEKEDLSASDLYGSDYDQPDTTIGWVNIRVRDKDTGKITGRIQPSVSTGAHAEWGVATRSTAPDRYYDTRVPADLDSDEYIYIKVTSEDGLVTNYFRFLAKLLSWTTNLQYITIGAREGKAGADIHGHSTGGSVWDDPLIQECSLSIAQREGQNALVEATLFDPNATAKYAVVDRDDVEPKNFTPSNQRITINDGNFLYVEVTAENQFDKEYFRFKVSVGRIVDIASLKFGIVSEDAETDIQVYSVGLPNEDWTKVGIGGYETANQPLTGFYIKLKPDDEDSKIVYGKISSDTAGQPTYTADNTPTKIRLDGQEALAIKVTSANNAVTQYYKVRITNLAATIVKHPKAAWYYQGTPAVPLTIELSPPDTGQYTYQWHEADSWYGLYGRHGTPLDEKNNLTTVNGGPGQYFYQVQPGEFPYNEGGAAAGGKIGAGSVLLDSDNWVDRDKGGEPMAWDIVGATGPTYTPRTDWIDNTANMLANNEFYGGIKEQNKTYPIDPEPPLVNFLSGATCESRYYWVTVTNRDTGLTVTSKRALILTETDPTAEHFIFDLSILPSRNVIPFTKQDRNDPYKIDLKEYWQKAIADGIIPPNWDPSKYQICIAHGRYILPDGRDWTQNWTHAWLRFGMDDGSLTWWHENLGANGGSIPLQSPHSASGGLTERPDWIGFCPSGDPAKGLPAPVPLTGKLPKGIYSMNATDPYPAGVAQGYFAGFVELLEVRFATGK
ncbi:hypothetical protein [Treponema sp. R80B11-R83G3]